jgi:hypothetical protein
MGMFGWSYPPGAASDFFAPYNQQEPPCEVCGRFDCCCPECPRCGVAGDPHCYEQHGLTRTPEQQTGAAALAAAIAEAAERCNAEAEYWSHPDRKREEAELEQYWRDLTAHNAERS